MGESSRSMKWRFSLWFGLLAICLSAAARYVHYRATVDLLARELDEQLWTRLGALDAERRLKTGALVGRDLKLADVSIPDLMEATDRVPSRYLAWVFPTLAARSGGARFDWFAAVWMPDGTPVAADGLPSDIGWQPEYRSRVRHLWTSSDGRYRLAAVAAHDGCVLLAGTPLAPLAVASREAAVFHAVTLAAVVPIGLVCGWLLIAWLLRPLDRITRTAERIRDGRFQERIDLAGIDSEIAGMATTLNAMLDRLDDVRTRLEDFNGDVAHQVLGPVHGILLEADATLRRPRSADELTRVLGDVRGLAARMESLCESLLAYSRTMISSVEDLPIVDLEPIVDSAVEQVALQADVAGVALDNRMGSAAVVGRAELLQEVFVNLLSNAIAHSRSGGTVTVDGAETAGGTQVRVVDHGDGVANDVVSRMFERHVSSQGEGTSGRTGHGVGLAICRSIMRSHGGDVAHEATPGGGATIVVSFPCRIVPHRS